LQLFGEGFVEGGGTYNLPSATVTDTSISNSPVDVVSSGVDNGAVNIPEPQHGLGNVTVTTAGGTSAPLAVNELDPGQGYLHDVAFDTTNNRLWVVDNNNAQKIDRVDVNTGQISQSITLTTAFSNGGLQVLPTSMQLNGTTVPAGSLLVSLANPNPD